MKKQEIARENIFSSIGRVTVVVYGSTDCPIKRKRSVGKGGMCITVGNLLLDDADHKRVFVRYRRDDLASYTHNYTFPLSPYGALYVNAWRAYLEEKCPAERLSDSAYIVSQDELGQKAFASGELITYIRTTVSAYTVGYAGRIKLEGMTSVMGVQLLRNTRKKAPYRRLWSAGRPRCVGVSHASINDRSGTVRQLSQLYRPNRSAVPLLEALPGSSRLPGTREGKYSHIYCPAPRWAAGDPHPACQWQQPSRRCVNHTGSDQCAARRCHRSPCSERMLFGYFKRVII